MKKLWKQITSLGCVGIMTASMVSGCAGSGASKVTTDSSKKESSKVSFMVSQTQNTEGIQQMFDKLAKEEGIEIDAQVIPDDQFLNMLQMKKASGELPDIIQNNVPHVYNIFDPEEELYDFSKEEWVSKLVNPDVISYNGKPYAFPLKSTSGYQSIIYNKDFFDENHLEIPTTPQEFDALCKNIKELGVTPILIPSEKWCPQIWTTAGFSRAMGSEEAAKEMTEKVFSGEKKLSDYPQLIAVVDELLALKDKGFVNDDIATLSWDDAWVELSDKSGAMLMGEGPMIGENQSTFPDTKFGVFNVPVTYDSKDLLSGASFSQGFVVGKDCENIDTVKRILNLFSTPEYLDLYFADNSGFPGFEEVNGGDMQEDVKELYETHLNDGRLVGEMNLHWGKIEPLFQDGLWTYYLEALTKGNMDGKMVLDKFQEDIDKYLKESGK